jgi:hypothetical protein
MNENRLAALADLTDLDFQIERSRLAALKKREDELKKMLDNLQDQLKERTKQLLGDVDLACLAGVDIQWQKWIEIQKREINFELATIRVESHEQTRRVAFKFGRNQVAKQIAGN